jgi:hypothetical protein
LWLQLLPELGDEADGVASGMAVDADQESVRHAKASTPTPRPTSAGAGIDWRWTRRRVYPVGQYVLGGAGDPGYYGIRRFPYSTDMVRNPLTLGHIERRNRLSDTVPTPDPYADNAQVHSSGEVWATALWEGVAALVRRRRHPRSGPPRHEHRNVPRIRTIRSADMVGASSLARACSE